MDRKQAIAAEIPRLRRYARALLGDTADADDLVQDCLERALNKIEQWREGENPRKWLFTIMHNLNIDRYRRRAARPALVPIDEERDRQPGAPASAGQEGRMEINDVARALQLLPDNQRRAVVLIGLEEMSYRDAAEILDVPVGTLMSRLSRGREQLRGILGRQARQGPSLRRVK